MTAKSIDDRFDCQKILGEGAFAIVYRALDNNTGKTVALKVLKSHSVKELKRFRREGTVLSTVRHPNIVKIYELQLEEQPAYLTMEYLEGPSLAQLLEKHELPIKRAVEIVRQLAKALGHLHKLSIYHRDVKPENIMVVNDRAVLMDFNLALPSKGTMLTATGELLGTPRYIAPEIWYGAPSRENADVYALGVVFYEMLAGRESHFLSAITNINEQPDVPPPSEFKPRISRELDELVLKCVCRDANSRFQSLDEVSKELDACPLVRKDESLSQDRALSQNERRQKTDEKRGSKRALLPLLFLFLALALFLTRSENKIDSAIEKTALDLSLCSFTDGFYCEFPITGLSQPPSWQLWGGQTLLDSGNCFRLGNTYVAEGKVKGTKSTTWLLKLISQQGEILDERNITRAKNNLVRPIHCLVGARTVRATWQLSGRAVTNCSVLWLPNGTKDNVRCRDQEFTLRAPKGATKIQMVGKVGSRTLFSNRAVLGVTKRFDYQEFSSLSRITASVVDNAFICLPNRLNRLVAFLPNPTGQGMSLQKAWEASLEHSRFFDSSAIADNMGGCLAYGYHQGKANLIRLDIRRRLKDKSAAVKTLGSLDTEWMVGLQVIHPQQTLLNATSTGDFYLAQVNAEGQVLVHKLSSAGLLKKLDIKEQEPRFVIASTIWNDQFVLLGEQRNRLLLYFFAENEMRYLHLDEVQTNKLPARLAVLSPKWLLVHIGNRLFLVKSSDGGHLSFQYLPNLPAVKPWEISEALLADNGSLTFLNVRPGITSKGVSETLNKKESFQVAGEVVRNTIELSQKPFELRASVIGRSVIFNDRTLRVFSHIEHDGLIIQPAFESLYVFSKETGKLKDKIRLFLNNTDIYSIGETLYFAPDKMGIRAIDLVDYE